MAVLDCGTITGANGQYTIDPDASGPDANRAGRFDLGRDIRGLAGLRAEKVFMVKMSYWFNP